MPVSPGCHHDDGGSYLIRLDMGSRLLLWSDDEDSNLGLRGHIPALCL